MSFVEQLDVPATKSRFSTSAIRSPHCAASSARPAPVMPPPTIRMSKTSSANFVSDSRRARQENSVTPIALILSLRSGRECPAVSIERENNVPIPARLSSHSRANEQASRGVSYIYHVGNRLELLRFEGL